MKAIVLSALVGMGILGMGPSHAEASWLSKALRGHREPRCQPVPPPCYQPPVAAACASAGYQGSYVGYDVPAPPPPVYQRPCEEGRASFRLEIRVPARLIEDFCSPPPCRKPARFCQPRW